MVDECKSAPYDNLYIQILKFRVLDEVLNAKTNVSDAAAKSKGSQVKNSWWMPPGAEDFVGLMYMFMGKGEQGNNHYKFFKETLFDPFSRAIQKINQAKQIYLNGLQELKKLEPVVTAELNEDIGVGPFTVSDGIRVYVWNKLGYEIPGISKKEINALVKAIENNAGYKAFGNGLIKLTKDITCFSISLIAFVSSDNSYNANEYLPTEVSEKFLLPVNL